MSKIMIAAAVVTIAAALPLTVQAAESSARAASAERGPATAVRSITLTAVVTKLDLVTRQATLRGEAGNLFDLEIGPEVKNLDKVKVGDTVAVTYTQALAARIATPAEHGRMAAVAASATPMAGSRPASVGAEVTEKLKVEAVDLKNSAVTLTDASGVTETVSVQDPALQERLKVLKAGDEVFVTFTESVALSLVPTGKR